MVIWTVDFQSTSSDHSQWRLPSSSARAARMFTTSSKSENSKRWGVSASRSLGPMSGSASIMAKTWSIASRSSFADSNEAPTAYEIPLGAGGLGSVATGLGSVAAGLSLAAAGFFVVTAAGLFAVTGRLRAAAARLTGIAGLTAGGFFAVAVV